MREGEKCERKSVHKLDDDNDDDDGADGDDDDNALRMADWCVLYISIQIMSVD